MCEKSKLSQNATIKHKHNRHLILYWPKTVTKVAENYLYVTRNLFAEIGGYIGIFWGFSLLNVADAVVDIFNRCFGKSKKTKKHKLSFVA